MQLTPQQLRRVLLDAGFEVFRTRGDEVVLAERPRDNLILDSGVRVRASLPVEVRVAMRAHRVDFPGEDELKLLARARAVAKAAEEHGFLEISTNVSVVHDPGDSTRTLDTVHEVLCGRPAVDIEEAIVLVRLALSLEKRAE